jgi:hypothetical protein
MLKSLSDLFTSIGVHPVVGGFLLGVFTCYAASVIRRATRFKPTNASDDQLAKFRDPDAFSGASTAPTKPSALNVGVEILLPEPVLAKVVQALREGKKIEAVKLYRDATRLGLKESKDAVEAMQAKMGL